MANLEILEEYLLGNDDKNGYLNSEISDNKVIMLSGKWGSGKTNFWQNIIIPKLNDGKNKIPNHYISLYGKTSIEQIKQEVFINILESMESYENKEKTKTLVKNSVNIFSSLSKSISVFGINIDLSNIANESFIRIDKILENEKIKKAEEYLNSGAIICFDDFERKSKDIDLNDLFGFMTQLSLTFRCKVMIILNDNVFKEKEKELFKNLKEKTVSKYLYFNPEIEDLFNAIFDDKKYSDLEEYKELILKTLKEVEILNARIYIQVLDNLL
ncbi:P-loop NTPase fold protein, partial [Arcobacter sp. CECT 8985]|uniref:P-loop NTPase fold protein n=1 Tax=Arcobacter sp. CECT 8985 TaxID=1935424 RepID=UPI00100AB971